MTVTVEQLGSEPVTVPITRKRGQTPRPARSDAPVVIPRLEPATIPTPVQTSEPIRTRTRTDLFEVPYEWFFNTLIDSVNKSEAFWELDPCGRTRVLVDVLKRVPADADVEIADALYTALPNSDSEERDYPLNMTPHPALLVNDDSFLEVDAICHYKARHKLMVQGGCREKAGSQFRYPLTKQVSLLVLPLTRETRYACGIDLNAYRFQQTNQWHCSALRREAYRDVCVKWGRAFLDKKDNYDGYPNRPKREVS